MPDAAGGGGVAEAGGVLVLLLAAHLVAAVAAPALTRRLGRRVFLAVGLAPAATAVWAAAQAGGILDGAAVVDRLPWAPALALELRFRVDAFSLLMVALVSGVGALIFAYSRWYFGERPDLGRLAGLLVAFAGSMLGLVVADDLLALFLFWELTSITSYLLIGIDDREAAARSAAQKALLTTVAGGLAMLGGLVLLGEQAGTYSLSGIIAAPPTGALAEAGLVLVLLGAFAKSAQAPFHFWLPGAMAAPTPISAYLHSATMVKAGVYLIARLAPAFAGAAVWRPSVIAVGLVTMVLGGWRALAQHDLKLLLAYGTVSQLGFMVVLLGAGFEQATLAGAILLLAHGAFKAALFMVVGIVDHQAHTRDLRRLTGLHRSLRPTFVIAALSAASMAGLPPLLGFVAKEAAYEAFVHGEPAGWGWLVVSALVAGSVLTFAYSARFLWGAFATKGAHELEPGAAGPDVPSPRPGFVAPAALLAALTAVLGVAPGLAGRLVVAGAQALDALVPPERLKLWHGVNEALLLSALTVAGGAALWAARRPIERLQGRHFGVPDAGGVYDAGVEGLLRLSDRLTGALQSGSLPVYLIVTLATVLAVPAAVLLTEGSVPRNVSVVDRPMQLPVAALLVAATIAAVVSRRRLAAVLAVGAAGYGVAVLFIIQGAPDLALTQVLIETLILVLFVLVLRHLPLGFPPRGLVLTRATATVLAVAVGVFAAVFALVATAARTADPVSDAHLARALPDAGGRNVVNVILVDFRAFDTLGEIVVLTVAALGVIGLVRAVRRERARFVGPLRFQRYRPSLILHLSVQVLFHTVVLFSLVLLVVGHDHPGGGFIGGLVAGAAFMLVYVAGGTPGLRRAEPIAPEVFLGAGVTLAALAGAAGWIPGGEFLQAGTLALAVPVLGEVKLSTTLVFDAGVYLVVLGLAVALLQSLGREEVQVS